MPASEARIRSNQANALKAKGPVTVEGKRRSRENSFKHGLTGAGVVLPAEDAAEVERLGRAFEAELKPSGDVGRTLVRRMALMSVRMDRCVDRETAALTERVREVEAEFDAEWPAEEGVHDPARERMRAEVARRAMFDTSKDACLARKYEASAERCFFRSLKEFRQVEKAAKVAGPAPVAVEARSALGSFSPAVASRPSSVAPAPSPAPKPAVEAPKAVVPASNPRPMPRPSTPLDFMAPLGGVFEVPFSIGRVG
jgi:hypothetical protein